MVLQLCGSYSAAELSPPGPALAELRQAQAAGVSLSLYMEESVQELLRDAAERFKGWVSVPGPQHTELACKKVGTALPVVAMGLGEGLVQVWGPGIPKEGAALPVPLCLALILGKCQSAKQEPNGPRGFLSGIILPELPPKSPTPDMSLLFEPYVPSLPAPWLHCASATDVVLPGVTCPKHYISQATGS